MLNSPIELGVRSLILLTSVFPKSLDLGRLTLMDYCLVHSADIGGPESIFPALPIRSGEFGMKRTSIERGLQVMVRAGKIDILATPQGIFYKAREEARPFLQLLRSPHVEALSEVVEWVADEFGDLSEAEMRSRMVGVTAMWSGELNLAYTVTEDEKRGEAIL